MLVAQKVPKTPSVRLVNPAVHNNVVTGLSESPFQNTKDHRQGIDGGRSGEFIAEPHLLFGYLASRELMSCNR